MGRELGFLASISMGKKILDELKKLNMHRAVLRDDGTETWAWDSWTLCSSYKYVSLSTFSGPRDSDPSFESVPE